MSRLNVTRGDLARLWATTAKLQLAAGKTAEAQHSLDTARRVREVTGWLNQQGSRTQALSDSRRARRRVV